MPHRRHRLSCRRSPTLAGAGRHDRSGIDGTRDRHTLESILQCMEIAEETKIEVDCGTCAVRSPRTCAGCLVTHICDRSDDRAVVITIDELRSMRLFNEAGMLPELRHAPRRAS